MALGGPAWTSEALASPHHRADKAGRVRRMFNGIAPRYALINSLFSLGRDTHWRRKAVDLVCLRSDDRVLDIACGPGDFARAFTRAGGRSVVGCDFAHEMLRLAAGQGPRGPATDRPVFVNGRPALDIPHGVARAGCQGQGGRPLHDKAGGRPPHGKAGGRRSCEKGDGLFWCEADALRLPFRDGSFSITSCAFGVRNFQDLDAGLAEMFRVLEPGGRAVILEFTRPQNRLARGCYALYAQYLMPIAATLIAGDRTGAYRYLPRSVVTFLGAEQMCARLRQAGFAEATATPLTMGIVTVYVAERKGS